MIQNHQQLIVSGVQLTASQLDDPTKELSTQQTTDFLLPLEDNFESVLTQIDSLVEQSTQSTITTTNRIVSTKRKYALPKRQKYVDDMKKASIPQKTKLNTDWAVKVWTDWAESRNARLLPKENPFSVSICDLTVSEMNFWLSRYILEIRKKDGQPYPPNSLYSLYVGYNVFLPS